MSQSICIAIIEQGIKKGNKCIRPAKINGYCGKHEVKGQLEISLKDGNRKCSRYRCLNTFKSETNKNIEYCIECSVKKEQHLKSIILCAWKETECKFKSNASGFCGKHEPRGILLKTSENIGQRICDNGKRACKNILVTTKKKCEECLEKNRNNEKAIYHMNKENYNCTQCGKEINKLLIGIRNHEIQKCEECYEKTRKIEDDRTRERNYSSEKMLNPLSHFRKYIESACKRNIQFELNLEEFIAIVSNPCNYCEYYSKVEVIGIDRVDSSLGYIKSNIVPCCQKCNMMKGELTLNEFKEHVNKLSVIFLKASENTIVQSNIVLNKEKSYIRPTKIVNLYIRDKLDEYIKLCIEDNRSPIFIQKLKDLKVKTPKLSPSELKKYIKNILFAETRTTLLTDIKVRKRIPRKEIIGYLKLNNIKAIVNLYENTFGKDDEVEDDFTYLGSIWDKLSDIDKPIQLEKILIKYQNRRAKSKV